MMQSLAQAFRDRAKFLDKHQDLEYGWADTKNVIGALLEFADVIDSWSGEYLSKELTYEENQKRRWGSPHWTIDPQPPMTMEERIEAVKKPNKILDLGD